MRLDPKHFNKFIAITAFFTVLSILYFTKKYVDDQRTDFQSELETNYPSFDASKLVTIEDRRAGSGTGDGSGKSEKGEGGSPNETQPAAPALPESAHSNPATNIFAFWASWSGKSLAVLDTLRALSADYPGVQVTALAVKDDSASIFRSIESKVDQFLYVQGTDLYGEWAVPGVPTLVIITSDGTPEGHVGIRPEEIRQLLGLASN